MTDTELFEIVKVHREAWPERAVHHRSGEYAYMWIDDGKDADCSATCLLAFEAAFMRALLAKTDVYATPSHGGYTVQVRDLDFEAPTLIEAYAKALEWLK
jgi:hypothetical protein